MPTGHTDAQQGATDLPAALFQDILGGLDTAVIVAGADNRLIYCNRQALKLLGVNAAQSRDLKIQQLLPDLPAADSESPITTLLHKPEQEPVPVEARSIPSSQPGQRIVSLQQPVTRPSADKQTLLQQHVLSTISQAQTSFIQRSNPGFVFDFLLPDVLALSESEFGFIASLARKPNGALYARVYTNNPFPWATIAGSVSAPDDDSVLEIHDLHPLLTDAVASEEPCISNREEQLATSLYHNQRHTLRSLLIVPIIGFDGVIGVLATGNGKTPYSNDSVEMLQPISGACASFLRATRELHKRRESKSRLIEEKQAAEHAAKAKSEFLATMSHELRTPLNGLLGMLHFLSKTLTEEKQKFYIRNCLSSGEILHAIINDILDFSKIEAGQIQLEQRPFSLEDLTAKIKDLYTVSAEQKNLVFHCECNAGTPAATAIGDFTRIFQILANLVTNAIKFTPSGSVSLQLNTTDNGLEIRVKDTGIGIPEAQQSRLFNPFTQADSSHSRRYGGTGLGLAITQKLTHAMAGTIDIHSEEDKGSEFIIRLPLQISSQIQHPEPLLQQLQRLSVTLIDTDHGALAPVCENLQHWGVRDMEQITSLASARQRIEAGWQQQKACLIISEWSLPVYQCLLDLTAGNKNLASRMTVIWRWDKRTEVQAFPADCPITGDCIAQAGDTLGLLERLDALLENDGETLDHKTPSGLPAGFGQQKILLAEDNPINQLVAIELLEDVGFVVDVSENGRAAVDAAINNDYDLILMDIQMPLMDGLEATRAIRSMGGRLKDIPIVAMTANASNEDIESSRRAGMNEHITKPINVQTLLSTIAGFIGHQDPGQLLQKTETRQSTPTEALVVPGIDTADGLNRINGNITAYKRILENFARQYATLTDDLDALLADEQWEEAIRLTHTLKGSSGNIGAQQLYQLAAEAENHCRQHNNDALQAMTDNLQAEATRVTTGIHELFARREQEDTPAASGSLPETELVAELEQIQESLNRDIAETENRLEALCTARLNTETRAALLEARDNLLCFNIKNVKAQLAQLLESMKGKDQHRA